MDVRAKFIATAGVVLALIVAGTLLAPRLGDITSGHSISATSTDDPASELVAITAPDYEGSAADQAARRALGGLLRVMCHTDASDAESVRVRVIPASVGFALASGLTAEEEAHLAGARNATEPTATWLPRSLAENGMPTFVVELDELPSVPVEIRAFRGTSQHEPLSAAVVLEAWPVSGTVVLDCLPSALLLGSIHCALDDRSSIDVIAYPEGHVPTTAEVWNALTGKGGPILHTVTDPDGAFQFRVPSQTRWRLAAGYEGHLATGGDRGFVPDNHSLARLELSPLLIASAVLADESGTLVVSPHQGNGGAIGSIRFRSQSPLFNVSPALAVLALADPRVLDHGDVCGVIAFALDRSADDSHGVSLLTVDVDLLAYSEHRAIVPFRAAHNAVVDQVTIRSTRRGDAKLRIVVHGFASLYRVRAQHPLTLTLSPIRESEVKPQTIGLPWPVPDGFLLPLEARGPVRASLSWGELSTGPEGSGVIDLRPGSVSTVQFDLTGSLAVLTVAPPASRLSVGTTFVVEATRMDGPYAGYSEFLAHAAPLGSAGRMGPLVPGRYRLESMQPPGAVFVTTGSPVCEVELAPGETRELQLR